MDHIGGYQQGTAYKTFDGINMPGKNKRAWKFGEFTGKTVTLSQADTKPAQLDVKKRKKFIYTRGKDNLLRIQMSEQTANCVWWGSHPPASQRHDIAQGLHFR